MSPPNIKTRTSRRFGWVVAALAGILALSFATYRTVQSLRHDDCTSVINTMPDGSQVTITTCS